ncbi:hypothetical protein Drorol1_Dr00009636 [Drosera rotundifolia]
MAVLSEEPIRESETDQYPLLREMSDTNVNQEHIIHIDRGRETSTSNSAAFTWFVSNLRFLTRIFRSVSKEAKGLYFSKENDYAEGLDPRSRRMEGQMSGPTIPEIVTLCSEFLNGGTDTTGTGIEWAMSRLIENPQIQSRLYEEIQVTVGSRKVEEKDVDFMPYLQAFVAGSTCPHTFPCPMEWQSRLHWPDMPSQPTAAWSSSCLAYPRIQSCVCSMSFTSVHVLISCSSIRTCHPPLKMWCGKPTEDLQSR